MPSAKAKTINLLLYEGTLGGVISIEESNWKSGELYLAPRKAVQELLRSDVNSKAGVYLLLSKDMVYVGKSYDLNNQIIDNIIEKKWWENIVILTTKENSFGDSEIAYLMATLTDLARSLNHLENNKKYVAINAKIDKFEKAVLDEYLEEALFLLQFIGITVFSVGCNNTVLNGIVDTRTKLMHGKRAKAEAQRFLQDKGVNIAKKFTYANRQEAIEEYWANPRKNLLNEDWWLVLNNNAAMELLVLKVPAGALSIDQDGTGGLLVRKDRPDLIDLNINTKTLIDRKSGINFTLFVYKRIQY